MKKIFLIISLISNLAFAQNAVFLNKDDKAPFSGDLLTVETTKQLYNDSLEKSSLQKQLDLTNQNNNLLSQEKQLLLDQNDKLIKAGVEDHNLNNWEKVGYFSAGIILTALAVKGAMSLRP